MNLPAHKNKLFWLLSCTLVQPELLSQNRIDGDLFLQDIKERRLPDSTRPKVAVLDTGFDVAHLKTDRVQGTLEFASNSDPDGANDKLGHGTSVAGLIIGSKGVGMAPGFHVMMNALPYKVQFDGIFKRAVEACRSGYPVINMSLGSDQDEYGGSEDEVSYKTEIKELHERGCLLIKSAGNDAVRNRSPKFAKREDSYLRVSASNQLGQMSYFSSAGEIQAPGSEVHTLAPQGTYREVSGTSFSAPITTALSAQILHLIRSHNDTRKLSPSIQIDLLLKIILSSQRQGDLNAVRALNMFEVVALDYGKTKTLKSEQEYKKLFDKSFVSYCNSRIPSCDLKTTCSEKTACLSSLRRKLAICDNAEEQDWNNLLKTYRGEDEVGMAQWSLLSRLRVSPTLTSQQKLFAREVAVKKTGVYSVLELFPALLSLGIRSGEDSDPEKVLEKTMGNLETWAHLSGVEQQGPHELARNLGFALIALKKRFKDVDTAALLDRVFDRTLVKDKYPLNPTLTFATGLLENKIPLPKTLESYIRREIENPATQWTWNLLPKLDRFYKVAPSSYLQLKTKHHYPRMAKLQNQSANTTFNADLYEEYFSVLAAWAADSEDIRPEIVSYFYKPFEHLNSTALRKPVLDFLAKNIKNPKKLPRKMDALQLTTMETYNFLYSYFETALQRTDDEVKVIKDNDFYLAKDFRVACKNLDLPCNTLDAYKERVRPFKIYLPL